jgi:hypothetical protein
MIHPVRSAVVAFSMVSRRSLLLGGSFLEANLYEEVV